MTKPHKIFQWLHQLRSPPSDRHHKLFTLQDKMVDHRINWGRDHNISMANITYFRKQQTQIQTASQYDQDARNFRSQLENNWTNCSFNRMDPFRFITQTYRVHFSLHSAVSSFVYTEKTVEELYILNFFFITTNKFSWSRVFENWSSEAEFNFLERQTDPNALLRNRS